MRFAVRRFSAREIEAFIESARGSSLSYGEVGATLRDEIPSGYNLDHNRQMLGRGCVTWERAKAAVQQWAMFDMPWVRLCWTTTPIGEGEVVAVGVEHYGFYSLNACRVVGLMQSSASVERFGFAYGTLLEHAERGEERFSVEWNREDDSVTYDLLAFSQPRMMGAKLAYPLSRALQKSFARESKAAMLRACS